MTKGLNKADPFEKINWILESKAVKERPCVFLSHKREDKQACREIAEYFKNAEINYYLDELDHALQQAAETGDPKLITESIKKGIRESSHMLVVVSERTFQSQWVPFEVGYGHSAIIDKSLEEGQTEDNIKLAILTLKDIAERTLPDFMQTAYLIRGINSLNRYIAMISQREQKAMVTEKLIFSHSDLKHPLDNVLKWEL